MKTVMFDIKGIAPILMHSERLANPFEEVTKHLKAMTKKRNRTEDDMLDIARIEWLGGLYMNESGHPALPGWNLLRSIVEGARLCKMGKAVERACMVHEDWVPLKYDGPSVADELFKNKRFVDMRSVKVGTSKVMRCRPIFRDWSCSFTILFDENVIEFDSIARATRDAGMMIGIGDYRPRFGRFVVGDVAHG
jgi:hypothetical protein